MMGKGVAPARFVQRALWHSQRHIGSTPSGKQSFPVGSARAWLVSENDVPPERLNISNSRRVVIKVGTAVVSNADGTLALSRLGALVEQVETAQRAFLLPPGESENPPC